MAHVVRWVAGGLIVCYMRKGEAEKADVSVVADVALGTSWLHEVVRWV